ncbi:MAG: c-type cytochrome [Beijerinckiaceae bacterium]
MAQMTPGKDPLLLNKIMGAVFGTGLAVMGLNILGETIFHPKKPAVVGYDLPSADASAAPAAGAAAAAVAPIAERLAKADAAKGEGVAKQCATCHGFKADGPAPSNGPRLNGIVGRAKGAASFAGYSAPMKERAAKGEKWDEAALDAFVANPKGYLPGTSMGFAGLSNPERRADLVAYLLTLK